MPRALVLGCLLLVEVGTASAQPEASDKLKSAVRILEAGRCEEARSVINAGLAEEDRDIQFLAGFMFSRGMCVKSDGARAARLLETAAKAAQADAATELVLMHGMGRGLAQSYAQAGRWGRAAADIGALSTCPEKPDGPACNKPKTLDVDYATALGYVATIHALAADDVRANRAQYLRELAEVGHVMSVQVSVVWPERALRVTAAMGDAPPNDASLSDLMGTRTLGSMLRAAYKKAIDAAAAVPCGSVPCAPVEVSRMYQFRLE